MCGGPVDGRSCVLLHGATRTLALATELEVAPEGVDRLVRFIKVVGIQRAEREIHVGVRRIDRQRLLHGPFGLRIVGLFLEDQSQRIV